MIILKDKKGFTLVEVVAAATILGITLISLLGVFISGTIGSAKAKHHIQAMNHARAAMEQYYIDGDTTCILPDGDIKSLNGSCVITDPLYATGIKKLTVTISWTEQSMTGKKPVSVQLKTFIRE